MEKTGTRKLMATTTMEMVLIMLALSVAYAENCFVPANHPRLLSSDSSYPLSLPRPPRRLLSLPARNDFMKPGSLIRGISKIPGVGKVIGKIPGTSKIPGVGKAGVGKLANCALTCGMFCPNNHGTVTSACYAVCSKIACRR